MVFYLNFCFVNLYILGVRKGPLGGYGRKARCEKAELRAKYTGIDSVFHVFYKKGMQFFYNLGDRRRLSIWTAHLSKDTIEPLILGFKDIF